MFLVVNVRVVSMRVCDWLMLMRMRMWLSAVPSEIVLMLVMRVMTVGVVVLHWLVRMFVFVVFGEVEPDAEAHEAACDPEYEGGCFVQE